MGFKKTHIEENSFVLAVYSVLVRRLFRINISNSFVFEGVEVQYLNDFSIIPGLLNKTYEKHEIEFVKKCLRPGHVFLDVGANIGIYSIVAAKTVGVQGRVFSFEPNPATFQVLERNVSQFMQITPVQMALAERPGRSILFVDDKSPGCSSLLDETDKAKIEVELGTIDDYIEHLHLPSPDFIKLDIEGYEENALKGCKRSLKETTIVLCEFNPCFLKKNLKNPDSFLEYLHQRFHSVEFIEEKSGARVKVSNSLDLGYQKIANLVLKSPRINSKTF